MVLVLGPDLVLYYQVKMGAAVEVDWGDVRKVPHSQEAEEYTNGPFPASSSMQHLGRHLFCLCLKPALLRVLQLCCS